MTTEHFAAKPNSANTSGKKAAIILAGTLVFSFLAGCATPSSPATPDPTPAPAKQTPTPTTSTPTPQDTVPVFSDREPKKLEAKILIDMGELHFADSAGVEGATFRVPAGKLVGLHIRNTGQVEHEIIFGRAVAEKDGALDGYNESLFDQAEADLFVFGPEKMEAGGVTGFGEIELEPGADAWIRVRFPETAMGTWEIGCFVPGHYEAGMKATLVIESPSFTTSGQETPSSTSTPPQEVASSGFSDREPKKLEAKILIDMAELHFADSAGVEGATFRVPAGKVVGLHIRNTGQVEHEIIFGRAVAEKDGALDGYNESLFDQAEADIFVFGPQKMEAGGVTGFGELELEPGADAWIRASFPETAKGTWEIGCFVPGHYEAGMKATLVIE